MTFLRKKKIYGNEYYYLVKSIRNGKNIERYVGLNPPTKKEIKLFEEEHDNTRIFFSLREKILSNISEAYKSKLRNASHDELNKIEEYIVTQFTYNTSRIEGSTLTLNDTNLLLNQGIVPGSKPFRDAKETENHKKAYIFMKNYSKDIDKNLILSLHKILKQDISEDAGSFRNAGVKVGNMIGLNHKLIPVEIDNLINWYKKAELHPIELVAQFHCTFERIHPFFDGNGRVGRLLMNHTLVRKGYPPVIIQNKNKKRYYNSLIKGQKGNYLLMIKYLVSELERWLAIL